MPPAGSTYNHPMPPPACRTPVRRLSQCLAGTGALRLDHSEEQRGWREIKSNEGTLGVILF